MHTEKSRNSVGMRRWTAIEFRSEIEIFETVAKWDGESPSQFEAKSTMDEGRNSVEMRWRTAFEFRSEIEIFETVTKWDGESPSQFEAISTMDESRNSVEMRWWTAFEFRSKIEIFETVVKWDDEPPSNFRVKSKFSKRCRNTTANRLRKSRRKRMYYKFRNRGAFRCRIAVEMRNCEISCEIFPTGIYLNLLYLFLLFFVFIYLIW